jgi:Ran GTPase-activating protein (RanGAP) involved in mRNA processing and transport
MQTLSELYLENNKICNEGAENFAIALLQNKVRFGTIYLFIVSIHPPIMQTLTTLDISDNQIYDQGAQCLTNALKENKVVFQVFTCY